jgi:hypothetical protein
MPAAGTLSATKDGQRPAAPHAVQQRRPTFRKDGEREDGGGEGEGGGGEGDGGVGER